MSFNIDESHLKKLFDIYTDPALFELGLILGDIQKSANSDWIELVNYCMQAMEIHDSGQFPDEWFPDEN